ncbi:MAG: hypothetical protein, partial [Olavius algarvensis Gamma 1 endosymbiont]
LSGRGWARLSDQGEAQRIGATAGPTTRDADPPKEERVHEKHERHEKEQSSPFRVFSCLPWTKNSCGCVVKTIPEPTRAQNPE